MVYCLWVEDPEGKVLTCEDFPTLEEAEEAREGWLSAERPLGVVEIVTFPDPPPL